MKTNPLYAFIYQCVSDTLDGLRDGLSHFSGPSRAAVIYSLTPEGQLFICDPQNLLQGHEFKFNSLYLQSNAWRNNQVKLKSDKTRFAHIYTEQNLQLDGLVSYGGRSSSVFYQIWFTEHHPDLCSIGPIERWLEHAAWRFSHDVANEKELYTGISGTFLKEYATHAVRDHIVDEMNIHLGWDSEIRIYQILDAVLGISRTREEGAWPRGDLVFIEPRFFKEIEFLARFHKSEQPQLSNFKHTRKLLISVEQFDYKLVSDGKSLLGISNSSLPEFYISADFRGRYGFLRVSHKKICSFSDGNFKSTTRKAKLVQVEEALLESDLHPSEVHLLFKIIASLVHHAQIHEYGCTLVIDLNQNPVYISGQTLQNPLDLREHHLLELAKSLSKLDGALHICSDQYLHKFACLLDGRAIASEDRSRGARYNSALRFSAEHANIIVVVVSSDRPVSIIQEGLEISAQCQWKPVNSCKVRPETLEDWIVNSGD
ncbi:DNA integrity scanning protein DisA nucleotide-binding domain protein [Candidatus Magnetomoraceae bacterium gMMP-15]